jgi:hypothetical protein
MIEGEESPDANIPPDPNSEVEIVTSPETLTNMTMSESSDSEDDNLPKRPPTNSTIPTGPLPFPKPQPNHQQILQPDPQPGTSKSGATAPRLKVYPENAAQAGPWVVFFRPKPNGKPLNVIQISRDLAKWTSVTEITKVRPNKLRAVVANLKAANEIVASQFFTIEYRVYIPSRDVEIEGVISDESLTVEDIKRHGVGRFKNLASTNVKILDCCQLVSGSHVNGQKTYTPSASFRVTFEGTALPHYVVIDNLLRLPVRLFVPRPMNCRNCKTMGHTASHCCNKTRCSICGEKHGDGDCTSPDPKCVYCKGAPHDLSACEAFKSCWDKQKRSIKERSKRSYAAILKSASPPTQPPLLDQLSNNVFAALSDDEGAADPAGEGTSFVLVGNSRKRRPVASPKLQRKIPAKTPSAGMPPKPNATEEQKQVPPGFRGTSSNLNIPAFPGTSKTPNVPASTSVSTAQTGLFKLSDIVDGIFTFFNVPDSIRSFVTTMLPIVKSFLQQLMQQWPLLAMIVSIDV